MKHRFVRRCVRTHALLPFTSPSVWCGMGGARIEPTNWGLQSMVQWSLLAFGIIREVCGTTCMNLPVGLLSGDLASSPARTAAQGGSAIAELFRRQQGSLPKRLQQTSPPAADRLPLRQVRPEDVPAAAYGRRSLARLQAVRHPNIDKEYTRSQMSTFELHRRLCVCQYAVSIAGSAILLL